MDNENQARLGKKQREEGIGSHPRVQRRESNMTALGSSNQLAKLLASDQGSGKKPNAEHNRDGERSVANRSRNESSPDASNRQANANVGAGRQSAPSELSSPPTQPSASAASAGFAGQVQELPFREEMEKVFQADLSGIKAYFGEEATIACEQMGADGYALGPQIAFRQRDPDKGLVAHEVTHALQQGAGGKGQEKGGDQQDSSADAGWAPLVLASATRQAEVQAEAAGRAARGGGDVRAALTKESGQQGKSNQGRSQTRSGEGIPQPRSQTTPKIPTQARWSDLTITEGGRGKGLKRSPNLPVIGDTIKLKAMFDQAVTPGQSREEITGRVLAEGAKPSFRWTSPKTLEISVTVGNMGKVAKKGEPPSLVDANIKVTITDQAQPQSVPDSAQPKTFDKSYQFGVLADLAYLVERCNTAALEGSVAYRTLKVKLMEEYLEYNSALKAHQDAVNAHAKREQLENSILLGIFLAGVGGAAGGELGDILKPIHGAALATAQGDIVKYIVRLGGTATDSRTQSHTSDTPPSSSGPSTEEGADASTWMAAKEVELERKAVELEKACLGLKKALEKAWAEGKTELMDSDPVEIVQPYVTELNSLAIAKKSQQEYAIELWRHWLPAKGITVTKTLGGLGAKVKDKTAGHTRFTDSKLMDDIRAQCGNALDAEVQRLRNEIYPQGMGPES